jgi:hypothetical protein
VVHDAEGEETVGSQHARGLRDDDVRIAKADRAVVAEHRVERAVAERKLLAAGLHKRNTGRVVSRMRELHS